MTKKHPIETYLDLSNEMGIKELVWSPEGARAFAEYLADKAADIKPVAGLDRFRRGEPITYAGMQHIKR